MNRAFKCTRLGLVWVLSLLFLMMGTVFAADGYILTDQGYKVSTAGDVYPKTSVDRVTWSRDADSEGYATGQGVLQWFSGDNLIKRFEGFLLKGIPNGNGMVNLGDGSRYEGNFVEGMFDGQGVRIYQNGARFEGSFSKGVPSGYGLLLNANGSYYWAGEFKGGAIEGSRYYPRGFIYVGEFAIKTAFPMSVRYWGYENFEHLEPHGYGTLYGPSKEIVRQGQWSLGNFTGSGGSTGINIGDLIK